MSDGNPDVMDTLAGLAEASPLSALRRQRPDLVKHLQGSDDAIFAPRHHGALTFEGSLIPKRGAPARIASAT